MKILPHPAPRQIPSNSVKFWRPVGPPRQSRQIPAAPRAPVKFRQIPSKYGPRSGPYYPPLVTLHGSLCEYIWDMNVELYTNAVQDTHRTLICAARAIRGPRGKVLVEPDQ